MSPTSLIGQCTSEPADDTAQFPLLRLPDPHVRFTGCVQRECPREGEIGTSPPRTSGDEAARASYRWFGGHHASFLAWRILADVLRAVVADVEPVREKLRLAELCYHTYSAMFLYASHCSAQTYATVLRPRMAATDPAFSGRWSRDFAVIPPLMSRVRTTRPETEIGGLLAAGKLNRLAHVVVARRLVPDGASLLRESGREAGEPPTPREQNLFDEFFRIQRGPACRHVLIEQVNRVFTAVIDDVEDAAPVFPIEKEFGKLAEHRAQELAALGDNTVRISRQFMLLAVRWLTKGQNDDGKHVAVQINRDDR